MLKTPSTDKRSNKRRRERRVYVRCTDEELARLQQTAEATGVSVPTLLRRRGLDFEPKPVVDGERILELLALRGDLGRAGGLLKLWLSDDTRSEIFDTREIRDVLHRLDETQAKIRTVIDGLESSL